MSETKKVFIAIFIPLIFSLLTFVAYHEVIRESEQINNKVVKTSSLEFSGCNPCTKSDWLRERGLYFDPDFLMLLSISFLFLSIILPIWVCSEKNPIERIELKLTQK